MRRRDAVLGLLSFAAGSIDALSFGAFGVFTSAMSGNTVLLGIAVGQLRLADALAPVLAFAGYGFGVALGTFLGAETEADRKCTIFRRPLAAETILLTVFATLQLALPLTSSTRAAMIVLAASGMGVQGATARNIRAPGINTVVFTSTLTTIIGAVASAFTGTTRRRIATETSLQAAMLAIYFAGAGVSAALSHFEFRAGVLPVACAALAALLSRSAQNWQ